MVEPRSPLADVVVPGTFGAANDWQPQLTLSHGVLGSLWQVAGWGDFAEAAEPVLAELGFERFGDYRTARMSGEVRCYRVSPDRIWLRDVEVAVLEAALELGPSGRLARLDLSHSRIAIQLCGGAAPDLLAKVASLDFSSSKFPVDGFAQTGIHEVAVLVHRISEDRFELLVPATWSVSIWDWLCVNAEPLGYRIEASKG